MPDKAIEWIVKFKHRGWITSSEVVDTEFGPIINLEWSEKGKETVKELIGLFEQIQTKASFLMSHEDFMWLAMFLQVCTVQKRPIAEEDIRFKSVFQIQPANYSTSARLYSWIE